MKFLRLFPSAPYLSASAICGILLIIYLLISNKEKRVSDLHGWFALLATSVLVILYQYSLLPLGKQINFSVPAIMSLIWTTRIVDLDGNSHERVQLNILRKLPFFISLIIMTITNHIGDIYGLVAMNIIVLLILFFRFKNKMNQKLLFLRDFALIIAVNLSYTFKEAWILFFVIMILYQAAYFIEIKRKWTQIEN
ncbi:MAG: hypothetical protein KC493_02225 [Bacteriovoracaceae bacterium]|nr:hypothetical protein [Bacteriovoracaceae bacterium]